MLENAEFSARLRSGQAGSVDAISKQHAAVTVRSVEQLVRFAQLQYDAGRYGVASELLASLRYLVGDSDAMGVAWGRLASDIVTESVSATEDLQRVKDLLDASARDAGDKAALQHTNRAWLLHWSVFVNVKAGSVEGLNRFIDLAMQEPYTNALQTMCPHLLRYVALAHVVTQQRRHSLRDVVRVVEQEKSSYSDPLTLFLFSLYVEYDFEAAQKHLLAAASVLQDDYFGSSFAATFVENARLLVFKSYCKIHQCIDLNMVAKKLEVTPAQAESFVVNLILNEQDAKIDTEKNHVVFAPESVSIHQKILERAQALSTQTALLHASVQRSVEK